VATRLNLTKVRHDLHQIPEIGLVEYKTSAYLQKLISNMIKNKKNVTLSKVLDTGFIVFVKGKNKNAETYAYRTDIDGLPIQEINKCNFKSKNKGFGHLCGHDVHMTVAIGILENILKTPHNANYLFLFQPGEEGKAGARKVYESKALNKYKISKFYACHVCPDFPEGVIASKPGMFCSGCINTIVNFIGQAAHSSSPDKGIDATMMAAKYIINIQDIITRFTSPLDNATVNTGFIKSSGLPNTIWDQCQVMSVLRYSNASKTVDYVSAIKRIAEACALEMGGKATLECDDKTYLPLMNGSESAKSLYEFSINYKKLKFEESAFSMISEDFGFFSNHFDATMM